MLKLATLPRSRRERDWWRATPGRSGKGAAFFFFWKFDR